MNKNLDKYRAMSFEELRDELKALRKKVFVLKMKGSVSEEEKVNFHEIKAIKKTIAFLLFLISAKLKNKK